MTLAPADFGSFFRALHGDWPPFAGSPAALAALAKRFMLVVLSNVDRESFARSEKRLGVTFDRVFTAEDVGSYKPDRRNFEYMLERLGRGGIVPGALVHVAQSRYHDIEPAKALGLRAVWVDRRYGRAGWGATPPPSGGAEPDLTVRSLAELATLLGQPTIAECRMPNAECSSAPQACWRSSSWPGARREHRRRPRSRTKRVTPSRAKSSRSTRTERRSP